jgi:hypothetical protein
MKLFAGILLALALVIPSKAQVQINGSANSGVIIGSPSVTGVGNIIPGSNVTCTPNVSGVCTGNVVINAPSAAGIASITWSLPTWLTASPNPLSGSGTQTFSAASGQPANEFLATPNGSTGPLSVRSIVPADVPVLNQNTTGTAANITATTNSTLVSLTSLTTVAGGTFGSAAFQPSSAFMAAGTGCLLTGCTLTGALGGTSATFTGVIQGATFTDSGLLNATTVSTNGSGTLVPGPLVPATFAAITNEFLTSYTASTGLFTAAQPSFSNLTGSATAAQTPTACQLTGCTLTGTLEINAAGTVQAEFNNSAVATGSSTAIVGGLSLATNNGWDIIFQNVGGSGSSSNTMQLGIINENQLTISTAGALTVPSSLTASSVIDTGLVSSTFIGTSSTGQLIAATLPTQPATFAAVANEFLTSYTSSTGLFTAAQPSFSNLTGSATAAQTPTACQLTGCTLTGGLTGTSLSMASITLNGGTPWTSSSSANSQVVTCPTGGTGTQLCDASGVWVNPAAAGVSSINTVPGAFTFSFSSGAGSCSGTTCNFTGSSTGAGTVTTFMSGNLSPLFTTSVANASTTPTLSFVASSAASNTVFGNFTGSSAVPTFSASPVFSAASLTNFPTFNQNTTGTAANITATSNSTLTTLSALTTAAGGAFGTAAFQPSSAFVATGTACLLTGCTLTGALHGTTATFSGSVIAGGPATTADAAVVSFGNISGIFTANIGVLGEPLVQIDSTGAITVPGTASSFTGQVTISGALDPQGGVEFTGANEITSAGNATFGTLSLSGALISTSTGQIVGGLTNTPINGSAIGASIASTGSFTTLSATGLTINTSGTASSNPIEMLQPSLATGNTASLFIGTAATGLNSLAVTFDNVGGTGSGSNLAQFGVVGGSPISVDHTGKLSVPGQLLVQNGLNAGVQIINSQAASTFPVVIEQPSLSTGSETVLFIGTALSTNNGMNVTFVNTGGAGSASNLAQFGVTNGAPISVSPSGNLTIPGAITGNDGAQISGNVGISSAANAPLAVSNTTATNGTILVDALQPSLATGGANLIGVGTSVSTNNMAELAFDNVGGSGSPSNTVLIGLVNGSELTIGSTGSLTVPGQLTGAGAAFSSTVSTPTLDATNGSFTNALSTLSFTSSGLAVFLSGTTSSLGYAGNGSATLTLGSSTIVGTGATVACTSGHSCDQFSGDITLVTGTTPTASGAIVTVTFLTPRSSTPNCTTSAFNQTGNLAVTTVFPITTNDTLVFSNGTGAPATASSTFRFIYVCGGI